jgi:hypothetical protein
MLEKRLSIGDIKRGSTVIISGKVTYLESGDIKHGSLSDTEFKVVDIGKNTLRLRNSGKDILLTSADKVETVKGDNNGTHKHKD